MEQKPIVVLASNESTTLASYEDKELRGDKFIIIDYSGQKSGRRDNLVLESAGGVYIRKTKTEWRVIGIIVAVAEKEKINDVRRFELVVKNTSETFVAKTKQELLRQLNFVIRDPIQGISYADMIA